MKGGSLYRHRSQAVSGNGIWFENLRVSFYLVACSPTQKKQTRLSDAVYSCIDNIYIYIHIYLTMAENPFGATDCIYALNEQENSYRSLGKQWDRSREAL